MNVDDTPTPGSANLVKSSGVYKETMEQIMTQFGGRFGVKNIVNITTSTTVTSAFFDSIINGRTTIINKSSSTYRVIYRNEIIKKGTVIHFTGTTTTSRAQYYGITQEEPGENIIGMELDHCYVATVNGQHDDWFMMPYDGYFFYAFYNQNWSDRNFDVVEPTDEILTTINRFSELLSSEIVNYTEYNFGVNTTGKYGTSTNYKHGCIAVEEGEQFIIESHSGNTNYAFVTSNVYSAGGDIPFVAGTSVINIPNNTSVVVTIPEGTSYLVFNSKTGYNTKIYDEYKIDETPKSGSDNLVKSGGVWRVTDNRMKLTMDDNTNYGPWRSLSKDNYEYKNNGLDIVENDGITTISVLLSESGVRFSLPIRELSKGRYLLEFDYSAVDGDGNVIELSETQRLYGGNNNAQYAASGTAPFISDIEFVETFDNNIGHYYYEFNKTEETPTYFYRSIYVSGRWSVGNVITITNMKFVKLIDDISDWYKETNDNIEKLESESSSLTPSLVSGVLKTAADNPDGAFKYVSIVPSASETYNAYYRTSLSSHFSANGNCLKRLTYYPEFIVCGGQDVTIKYTGLNGIVVFELPYRALETSPIDSFTSKEIIKSTALPSNQSETFTGEVTISLSQNCRRLAFVLGSTQDVSVTPSEIINNITEVTLPVPDLENLSFGSEYQHDSIINAARQARFVTGISSQPSIGLLHYTDLHGDDISTEQIHKYAKILKPFIHDIICTGDVVHYYAEGTSTYPQGYDWWQGSGLPEKSLFVLGNHDLATPEATEYSPKEGSAAWDGMGKEWGYENFFSPYISGLGITMPTGNDDSSSPYYHSCYWHKDYNSAKVRLIGVDCIHRFDGIVDPTTGEILTEGVRKMTAEQEIWLIEKLNETLDSENAAYGYHVMILCHYPLDDFSGDNKEWNDLEHEFDYNHKSTGGRVMNGRTNDVTAFHWKPTVVYTAENRFSMRGRGTNESKANNNVGEIIKTWMSNGGKFIAWVSGHRHADSFWYPTKYPEILSVALDQAGWLRGGGTRSRYVSLVSESYRLCANFYSVDTANGLFKIVRIGQNMDKLMNVINYLCYDYINKKVINES